MEKLISAQVILKWSVSPDNKNNNQSISSENINQYKIDVDAAEIVSSYFEKKQFNVSKIAANSFSITANQSLFQKLFKVKIESDINMGCVVSKSKSRILPLSSLPNSIENHISAITFGEPPQLF